MMLWKCCSQYASKFWKFSSEQAQDWKRSVFIPIPKKGNAREWSNCCTIVLISYASKVMLKILQAVCEPGTSRCLEKAQEPEIKFSNSVGSWRKQGNSRKNTYFCFIDYLKAFDCVDLDKLWKILKEMGIPDHRTCLLRKLYSGQEAIIRTGHGTTNWFLVGKRVLQGCVL